MTKIFHIAKANILKHKGAALSLFAIIMIVSALTTIGLSVLFEVEKDFYAGIERLHSLHSLIVMQRDKFEPAFEDTIKNDPRVAEYEITEVLYGLCKFNYGGEIEWAMLIADIDKPLRISAPNMIEVDLGISPEKAIYLPLASKNLGYKIGDRFTIIYINKLFELTVAGFFETNELAISNSGPIKFFVHKEGYEYLSNQLPRNVWAAIRHGDPNDSTAFINDFLDQVSLDTGFFSEAGYTMEFEYQKENTLFPIIIISVIILLFVAVIVFISLFVIRFRVTNNIDDTMREIGVLKASGYTSRQITNCYLSEYGIIAIPSSFLGIILSIPFFIFFRGVFSNLISLESTISINPAAGLFTVLVMTITVLLMVRLSCAKIKKLPPVDALRGGIATNNFRRNFFPLDKRPGNIHLLLGFKNMFAHFKLYAMIGVIIAGITMSVAIMYIVYDNLANDRRQLLKMAGIDISDVSLTLTRHTDADAFAAELENMSEVRKTYMLEFLSLKVEGYLVMGYISNDYGKMENMNAHKGRLPKYENEAAIAKVLADMLGKQIGDSVRIKANGVTQEFIITGLYSTISNSGQVATLTLEGFRRFDPNFRRSNVRIYLNDDVDYNAFLEKLKSTFGVLNVYRQEKNNKFASAKALAEEKISIYLEKYAIDSVEYAVSYNGEIILSGSSGEYQIKTIANDRELMNSQLGTYAAVISAILRLITLVSLVILSLILYMTVRSIVSRRRHELGVLKGCGYTTKQLTRQLAISFIPASSTGVILGCTIGAVSANPILDIMFASSGLYNSSFVVSPIVVALIGMATLPITYMVANISASRIKRISVYELISE